MRVFGIAGWKNTGKTGLTERLVAEFTSRGLAVSTVKHAHHAARLDQPGTDTDRHRAAGAGEVVLATDRGWALVHDGPASLDDLLARLSPADLVLVEGFKSAPIRKILCHRAEVTEPPDTTLPEVRAVASNSPLEGLEVPVLDLDDTAAIADFIAGELS